MNILYHNRHRLERLLENEMGARYVDMDTIQEKVIFFLYTPI